MSFFMRSSKSQWYAFDPTDHSTLCTFIARMPQALEVEAIFKCLCAHTKAKPIEAPDMQAPVPGASVYEKPAYYDPNRMVLAHLAPKDKGISGHILQTCLIDNKDGVLFEMDRPSDARHILMPINAWYQALGTLENGIQNRLQYPVDPGVKGSADLIEAFAVDAFKKMLKDSSGSNTTEGKVWGVLCQLLTIGTDQVVLTASSVAAGPGAAPQELQEAGLAKVYGWKGLSVEKLLDQVGYLKQQLKCLIQDNNALFISYDLPLSTHKGYHFNPNAIGLVDTTDTGGFLEKMQQLFPPSNLAALCKGAQSILDSALPVPMMTVQMVEAWRQLHYGLTSAIERGHLQQHLQDMDAQFDAHGEQGAAANSAKPKGKKML